jgi:hypothetical protein
MGDLGSETVKSDANVINEATDSVPHEHDSLPMSQPEGAVQSVRRAEEVTVKTEGVAAADNAADGAASSGEYGMARTVAPQQPVRRHGTAKPIV